MNAHTVVKGSGIPSLCSVPLYRRLSFLVLLLLIAGNLAALPVSPATAAQPDCPEGEVLDVESSECVPDDTLAEPPVEVEDEVAPPDDVVEEEPPAEEEPPVEVTPTETPEELEAESGTIVLNVRTCPEGLDPASSSASAFAEQCTGDGPDSSFVVFAGGSQVGSGVATSGSPSVAFEGVPVDNLTVSQSVPEGYLAPVIFCEMHDAAGSQIARYQLEPVIDGSSITGSLVDGAVLTCDWYNIPAATELPADEDVGEGDSEGASTPIAAALAPEDDGPPDPDLDGGKISVTAYQCLVPVFELPDEVLEVADPPITDGGSDGGGGTSPGGVFDDIINIDDLPVLEINDEFAGCTPTHTGVTFTVSRRNNQVYSTSATSSGSPAKAEFGFVWPEGIYLIQTIPENYSNAPVVVCTSSVNGPMRFEGAASQYGIVIYDMVVDETLTCNWYSYQLAAPGKVVVYQRLCESGQRLSADDYTALKNSCTTIINNSEIRIAPEGGSFGPGLAMGSTGTVTFPNVTPGALIIQQDVERIFSYPAVYCRGYIPYQPGRFGLNQQPIIGDDRIAIRWELQAGQTLYCEWFLQKDGFIRVVDGPITLSVHAIFCPPGIDRSTADIYDLAFQCHEAAQPVTVKMTQNGGGTATKTTPGTYPNNADFENLAELPVVVEQSFPEGYPSFTVFCDHLDGIPGNSSIDPEPLTGANLNQYPFALQAAPFGLDNCTSYYFPEPNAVDDDDSADDAPAFVPSSLLVNVHACPDDFDGFAADPAALASTCVEPLPGVGIVVGPSRGEEMSGATEGEFASVVEFTGLPDGAATVTATSGLDGYVLRVFCSGNAADGSSLAQQGESMVVEASIALEVGQGQSITCDWYAIPEEPILFRNPVDAAVRGPARDLSSFR
jgi:hypothetical protein